MPELMTLARQIKAEIDLWVPKLAAGNGLDSESVKRMEALQNEILMATPATPIDRLMQFGCARLTTIMLQAFSTVPSPDPEVYRTGVIECTASILAGLEAIRPQLEKDAGCTLDELGLFLTPNRLQ